MTKAELEAENAMMREILTVEAACRWFDRFHALDGIKDDSCPACGGPIEVYEDTAGRKGMPQGLKLRAVRL